MTSPSVKTPVGDAPVLPIGLLVIGGYLAWFGVHYFGARTGTADKPGPPVLPTEPIKAVLQGKPVPVRPAASTTAVDVLTANISTFSANTAASSSGTSPTSSGGPAPSVSGAYSHADLESLWTSQGGAQATANIAAAIAQAESSGGPDETSSNPDGGENVGLWQLDTKGVGSGYTVAQLKDPATNARVTIMGSANGTDWKEWATFASGAYLKFMSSSGVTPE